MKKSLPGIIPLFILIAVGVVIAVAGGTYIVRKQFIKTSPDKKASLDEEKIRNQIANPTTLPSPSAEPSQELAVGPYTYNPKEESKSDPNIDLSQPAFKITPPATWNKISSTSSTAIFSSPEDDEEPLEPPLTYQQPANIQIKINKLPQEATLEDVVNDLVNNQYSPYNPTYFINQKTNFAGHDAQLLEFKIRNKEGPQEHAFHYVIVKNNYSVIIGGTSLEVAWSKRSPIIKASINTFAFVD